MPGGMLNSKSREEGKTVRSEPPNDPEVDKELKKSMRDASVQSFKNSVEMKALQAQPVAENVQQNYRMPTSWITRDIGQGIGNKVVQGASAYADWAKRVAQGVVKGRK